VGNPCIIYMNIYIYIYILYVCIYISILFYIFVSFLQILQVTCIIKITKTTKQLNFYMKSQDHWNVISFFSEFPPNTQHTFSIQAKLVSVSKLSDYFISHSFCLSLLIKYTSLALAQSFSAFKI
jgi:hypothetical protein